MSEIQIINNPSPQVLESVLRYYASIPVKHPSFIRDRDFLFHALENPGVSLESVFVAMEAGEAQGIAIVSVTQGKELLNGNILEIAYSNPIVGKALLDRATSYSKGKGVDVLYCAPPTVKGTSRLFKGGWVDISGIVTMMVNLTSPVALLQALLTPEKARKFQHMGHISLAFEKGALFPEEVVEVNISDEIATVVTKAADGFPDADIRLARTTLMEIIFTGLNPYRAWLTGKVRIKNLTRVPALLGWLRFLSVPGPWVVQIIDVS